MATSVTMPRLGESVTEGTVTRWLKHEGDTIDADEPLLEVSTDKVDTEVPSPVSGTLLAIRVQEDETVEIGVELAVIGDAGESVDGGPGGGAQEQAEQAAPEPPQEAQQQAEPAPEQVAAQAAPEPEPAPEPQRAPEPEPAQAQAPQASAQQQAPQPSSQQQAPQPSSQRQASQQQAPGPAPYAGSAPQAGGAAYPVPAAGPEPDGTSSQAPDATAAAPAAAASDDDEVAGTYVTPLVRKLAGEHGVDLATVQGTGVGGRIRKSDVLAAAEAQAQARQEAEARQQASAAQRPAAQQSAGGGAQQAAPDTSVRGQTVPMSRMRQVIAARMVESLQTSAQLTTVVEVDVTRIARLRAQAKTEFERREGVKLSFLPFFAVAAIEALKSHPGVNASVDMDAKTITYHDAVHLGVAVDTERGLLVPVIHDAGDLNLGGIARKIADLADRTRSNRVTPDELGGGTFTITNTGSRGALFDTPIINQPQVAILGTGAVVKRPVVMTDADLGETIAVRSMVYLALTYDHRIVDGADAARFLVTVKQRLEAGAFERALGLA